MVIYAPLGGTTGRDETINELRDVACTNSFPLNTGWSAKYNPSLSSRLFLAILVMQAAENRWFVSIDRGPERWPGSAPEFPVPMDARGRPRPFRFPHS